MTKHAQVWGRVSRSGTGGTRSRTPAKSSPSGNSDALQRLQQGLTLKQGADLDQRIDQLAVQKDKEM
jgi:hypothetical protein